MSEALDSLFTEYQQKLLLERQALKDAETASATASRNIDRIEGALFGIKDAQAKILADSDSSPECEIPQEGIEEQG
tara:strand:- start:344 stop:571 length:228 start_codon:yes stop_codon:yes gene_type:complete